MEIEKRKKAEDRYKQERGDNGFFRGQWHLYGPKRWPLQNQQQRAKVIRRVLDAVRKEIQRKYFDLRSRV